MKVALFLLFLTYMILGFSGLVGYKYVDIVTQERAQSQFGFTVFWLTLLIPIVACVLLYYVYGKWTKRLSGKSWFGVFFVMLVAFGLVNFGMVRKINEWFGGSQPFTIEGKVVEKWIDGGSRGKSFHLRVRDDKTGESYHFLVSRTSYDVWYPDAVFKKDFRIGYYGIIYRKKP